MKSINSFTATGSTPVSKENERENNFFILLLYHQFPYDVLSILSGHCLNCLFRSMMFLIEITKTIKNWSQSGQQVFTLFAVTLLASFDFIL